MMENKSNNWGTIVYTDGEEVETDPIMMLIQKYDEIKNTKLEVKSEETIEQARERRQLELYNIDKEITDKIYLKRQKNLF